MNRLIVFLYNFSKKKMRQYSIRKNASFLKRNNLVELKTSKKIGDKYNGYQSTPITMCEALVKSEVINKNDSLVDIGSGCGIFLFYLAKQGFTNLFGVEINDDLYSFDEFNIGGKSK